MQNVFLDQGNDREFHTRNLATTEVLQSGKTDISELSCSKYNGSVAQLVSVHFSQLKVNGSILAESASSNQANITYNKVK